MDSTDFAIAMVSGVLIIMVIFLFILFKIFGTNRKNRPIQEIKGSEKEFQQAHDLQKMEFVNEIIIENKEDIPLNEPERTIGSLNETMQIRKDTKEEPLKGSTEPIKEISLSQHVLHSIEDNEKLKLEDILIEARDVNTQKKVKKKRALSKNPGKADMLKEIGTPEKKPKKRAAREKPGKKVSNNKKTQTIVNENPEPDKL